jgi:hypothetical protein
MHSAKQAAAGRHERSRNGRAQLRSVRGAIATGHLREGRRLVMLHTGSCVQAQWHDTIAFTTIAGSVHNAVERAYCPCRAARGDRQ